MLNEKFVEEYKKIKPTDELKNRIFYSVAAIEEKKQKKPFYLRMTPVLSGALACVLLVCCLNLFPFDFLEAGDVSVSYAQSGELIAPLSMTSRGYDIAMCDNAYYQYDELPNGSKGAEFTFEFEGKTEIKTEQGSFYLKNKDGSYEELGQKARIDGAVILFWAMPGAENGECAMSLKNRSGEWTLSVERLSAEYKANLIKAE